jgi:hypothetical protein
MNAINECYSAFAVAVARGCTVESAFNKLDPKVKEFGNRDTSKKIPDEDIAWLIEQRTMGVPYQDLGEIYGVCGTAVYHLLKRRGVLVYGQGRGKNA